MNKKKEKKLNKAIHKLKGDTMSAIVCGDRNWNDEETIRRTLTEFRKFRNLHTVIEGEARGADTIAKKVCIELGICVIGMPALWGAYGRPAGPIRNREMLKLEPDIVIAFHNNINDSKGTKNMVEQANKAGIPVLVISE